MKKSLLLKRISVLLSILFASWQLGVGQALLIENFDYSSGALLTANGWTAHSAGGTNAVDVIVPGLSFVGYPSGGIGGAAQLDNTGEDVNRTFLSQSTGTVYAAALVKVNTIADGYFLHLGQTTIGTTFFGRVFIKTSGANFVFGLSKTSEAATYGTTEYTVGTTYLIVLKYNIINGTTNDEVSLYVFNSSIPSTEPSTATIPAFTTTGADNSPGSVALRQFSATQNIIVDGIRIATTWADATSDIIAPVPAFDPANSAINVPVTVAPTITFDEPVRKTDGSILDNSNISSIITFKKTNSSGTDVPFTATIDASKKIVTITPASALDNSQLYYLAISAVEDANGNESTGSNATFTTIGLSTPTITVTAPNGGEKLYSGDMATVTWTTTNFAPGENVKIEAWVPNEVMVWNWIVLEASTPNDGSQAVMVGPNAAYSTQYLIRITGVTNGATDVSNNPFTVIATATTLADLRQNPADAIVKYKGIATVTYARTSYNQKYIQDATAAILIHDPTTAPGFIAGTYNIGDGITNVEGKITLYNGLIELVPLATTGEHATGTAIVPQEVNITTLTSADQSKLVKIKNLQFANPAQYDPSGLYIVSKNYDLTGLSNASYALRTAFSESDYIGTAVPTGSFDAIVLVGQFNAQMQVTPRSSADIMLLTGIEETLEKNIILFPVPASTELRARNIMNVNTIEILDATGRTIKSTQVSNENEIIIPITELKKGLYFIRFNTNSGSVVRRFIK